MNHIEEFLKLCDKVTTMTDNEKAWISRQYDVREGLKVRPMLVEESDDPCVYDTATGEFVFVNKKRGEEWK